MTNLVKGAQNRLLRARLRVTRVRRRETADKKPVIGLVGPKWMERWLSPDALVLSPTTVWPTDVTPDLVLIALEDEPESAVGVLDHLGWSNLPRVGYRAPHENSTHPAPFLQPAMASPLGMYPIADLPRDFQQLATAATHTEGGQYPRRRTLSGTTRWLAESAAAHPGYRQAHERTAADFLAEALGLARVPFDFDDGEVTVVCVTNRPENLENALDNYSRQTYPRRRLLLVTNADGFDESRVRTALAAIPESDWLQVEEDKSLGRCLNMALETCTTRYFAKFDDDDHYGPDYLGDLMIAHRYANAAVVGKHSYFAHLEDRDLTILRFPGREFIYTSYVAGGTMVIDTPRTDQIRFEDRSVGEDTAFLAACQRAGHDVFAADRFNYLQIRGSANTWVAPVEAYLRGSIEVGNEPPLDMVDV